MLKRLALPLLAGLALSAFPGGAEAGSRIRVRVDIGTPYHYDPAYAAPVYVPRAYVAPFYVAPAYVPSFYPVSHTVYHGYREPAYGYRTVRVVYRHGYGHHRHYRDCGH